MDSSSALSGSEQDSRERPPRSPDEGAPDLPAGGTPGGKEPNTRVVPGHEGESAADAQGSVLGRLKHPVSISGRVTNRGESQGAGNAGDAAEGAPVHASGVVVGRQQHSGADGDGGASYVGGTGIGDVAPQRAHGVEDLDRRQERRAEYDGGVLLRALGASPRFAFVVTDLIGNTHKQYYTPLLGTFLGARPRRARRSE